jgi:hypothetical protein
MDIRGFSAGLATDWQRIELRYAPAWQELRGQSGIFTALQLPRRVVDLAPLPAALSLRLGLAQLLIGTTVAEAETAAFRSKHPSGKPNFVEV